MGNVGNVVGRMKTAMEKEENISGELLPDQARGMQNIGLHGACLATGAAAMNVAEQSIKTLPGMEVQIREKCSTCGGNGWKPGLVPTIMDIIKIQHGYSRVYYDSCCPDCKGYGYIYRWVEYRCVSAVKEDKINGTK